MRTLPPALPRGGRARRGSFASAGAWGGSPTAAAAVGDGLVGYAPSLWPPPGASHTADNEAVRHKPYCVVQ